MCPNAQSLRRHLFRSPHPLGLFLIYVLNDVILCNLWSRMLICCLSQLGVLWWCNWGSGARVPRFKACVVWCHTFWCSLCGFVVFVSDFGHRLSFFFEVWSEAKRKHVKDLYYHLCLESCHLFSMLLLGLEELITCWSFFEEAHEFCLTVIFDFKFLTCRVDAWFFCSTHAWSSICNNQFIMYISCGVALDFVELFFILCRASQIYFPLDLSLRIHRRFIVRCAHLSCWLSVVVIIGLWMSHDLHITSLTYTNRSTYGTNSTNSVSVLCYSRSTLTLANEECIRMRCVELTSTPC